MVSSHQTRDLECFADSSGIPQNPRTIRYPGLMTTIPQMSLLSLCALLFLQSHLFLICVALKYNDSRIIPRKTCQIRRICQCKLHLVSSLAPRTSFGSSGPPGKFLFHRGMIVSIELPNLVPPRRIDETFLIRSCQVTRNFRSGHKCTSTSSARSPHYFCLQADIAIGSFGKCAYTLCVPEPGSTYALATPLVIHEKNW